MRYIVACFMLCASGFLYGQTDSLSSFPCTLRLYGKVLDGENKEPLAGAGIFIKESNTGCITDEKGECVLTLCPGIHKVEVNYYGYKTLSREFQLVANSSKIFMLHTDTCLMESVVLNVEPYIPKTIQPRAELQGKALDKTRGFSLGESLKQVAGVNALQTGPSIFKPVIQGMYGNRVLIMNNGVRQEGQQWGSEHAPELDPFIASKLTVVKGAASVQYGSDAIGGVILVDPAELKKDPGLSGEVTVAGFSNNRQGVASGQLDYASGKIKGLSLRVQGTVRRAGNSKTPDYYMKNTGLKEQNFSWSAAYQKEKAGVELFYSQFNSTMGIFSASHIGNLNDLRTAINSPVPLETSGFTYQIDRPFQQADHELFKVKSYYENEKLGRFELTLARQFNYRAEYDKHLPLNNPGTDVPQVRFKITTHTATLSLAHNRIGAVKGNIGANFIRQGNTSSGTARSFIPNFLSYAGGFFVMERWRRNNWEAEAGARYDVKWMKTYMYENDSLISPEFRFHNFSGSIGVSYTLGDWKIGAFLSTAFRPVAANELFSNGLHHGSARMEYGDRNLQSEYAYNQSLTFNYAGQRKVLSVDLYNNYIQNYIYVSPGMVYDPGTQSYVPEYSYTVRGAFPVFRYKQANALFSGIDGTLKDSITKNLIFTSKLSLLRAFNLDTKEYILLTPPANFEYGFEYAFQFSGNIINPYVQATHLLVARKKKVPVDQDLLAPPSGYMIFNFESGFRWMAGRQPIDVTFSIYNLLNTRYRDYMDRFRYFTDAVGRNVVLRIKVPFDFNRTKKTSR